MKSRPASTGSAQELHIPQSPHTAEMSESGVHRERFWVFEEARRRRHSYRKVYVLVVILCLLPMPGLIHATSAGALPHRPRHCVVHRSNVEKAELDRHMEIQGHRGSMSIPVVALYPTTTVLVPSRPLTTCPPCPHPPHRPICHSRRKSVAIQVSSPPRTAYF